MGSILSGVSEIQKIRKSETVRQIRVCEPLHNVRLYLDEEGFVAFEAECKARQQTFGERLTAIAARALGQK